MYDKDGIGTLIERDALIELVGNDYVIADFEYKHPKKKQRLRLNRRLISGLPRFG